jgi:glycosyltransferase involved in cell wall biosynthesis
MPIDVSILIPSIEGRRQQFLNPLLDELDRQLAEARLEPCVEILVLYDRRILSVGAKRNALLDLAQGAFLTYIDDDDWIAPDYLATLRDAAIRHPEVDVITYNQVTTINEGQPIRCTYGLALPYWEDKEARIWTGRPAHTMLWRSAVAKQARFPEKNFAEDVDWVAQACRFAETEVMIEKDLYYYRMNYKTSATQGHLKPPE